MHYYDQKGPYMKIKTMAVVLFAAGSMLAETRGSFPVSSHTWIGGNAAQSSGEYVRGAENRNRQPNGSAYPTGQRWANGFRDGDERRASTPSFDKWDSGFDQSQNLRGRNRNQDFDSLARPRNARQDVNQGHSYRSEFRDR